MKTYVALLRGINVGGRNLLPMKELVELFSSFGYENIHPYIQSGNVVFQSPKEIGKEEALSIGQKIAEKKGFKPHIMILQAQELHSAIKENPFPGSYGKALCLFFLSSKPERPDIARLVTLKAGHEEFVLTERVFYLLAPEGIGRSKLAQAVESALGVPATVRNWNTVRKLAALIEKALK